MSEPTLILYHENCPDGFGAAWAAWKKFGKRARYIGVRHQEPPPPGLQGKEIYLLDFTYPLPIMRRLLKKNARVSAIDHHLSAKEAILKTEKYSYSLKNSGAVLAWRYFHKARPPLLLRYIEDFDLWRFRMPRTREVGAALEVVPKNFRSWSRLAAALEKSAFRNKYIEKGKVILEYQKVLIEGLVKNADEVRFLGKRAHALNSPILISEIGHALYTKFEPLALIWHERGGRLSVSLRSDGSVDVSKIARRFGGGGHREAASFKVSAGRKPWRVLLKNGKRDIKKNK